MYRYLTGERVSEVERVAVILGVVYMYIYVYMSMYRIANSSRARVSVRIHTYICIYVCVCVCVCVYIYIYIYYIYIYLYIYTYICAHMNKLFYLTSEGVGEVECIAVVLGVVVGGLVVPPTARGEKTRALEGPGNQLEAHRLSRYGVVGRP